MTIAEQLSQEGKLEGYQLGRHDGINEGMQQGEKAASRKTAQQLLASGAERNLIKMSTVLSDEELNTFPTKRW